jgi:type II secretory pathway pseudopilin PulG
MGCSARGFTTVEALVAVTVFGLGALGAAGSVAVAIRSTTRGSHLSRGTRLLAETFDSLRGEVREAGHRCLPLVGGTRSGSGGEQIQWTTRPARGGRELVLVLAYPTAAGVRQDSVAGFLRCQ